MNLTLPIRNKTQVQELAALFLECGEIRNHVLIVLSVNTALRVCDLLCLTWDDVYDFENCLFHESISVIEKKTGKSKVFLLNSLVIAALNDYLPHAIPGGFLFTSRKGGNKAISRQQAYRIIRQGAETLGFANRVSCHSLRKTFGYLAWNANVSPVVIMEIYNHSSLTVTKRYLGVVQDDLDDCYRKVGGMM